MSTKHANNTIYQLEAYLHSAASYVERQKNALAQARRDLIAARKWYCKMYDALEEARGEALRNSAGTAEKEAGS